MKLKFEVILAQDLGDGDIFYCTPDPDLNEFGDHFDLTGTDQIFIRDDFNEYDDEDNYSILVNGGWTIWFKHGEQVVRLGHYSDFIRVIEMVKEGNPNMELGPNDIMTKIEYLKETGHLKDLDLLANRDNIDFDNNPENKNPDDELPL